MTNIPRASLDHSFARAFAWNAASRWSTQIFSWICTIIIARLLSPSDYGLSGMAGLYLGFATLISSVGIADAVIALRDLTRRQIAELNTLALLIGVGLVALSCAVAVPMALFFRAPALSWVIIAASSIFLINAPQVVPRALLQRELRFKLLAALEPVRIFFQMAATITLACFGFGYWSLVCGPIVGMIVSTSITVYYRRHEFALPSISGLQRELRFSGDVMLSGAGWYFYSNADFLVAGRLLGQVPLGDYTVAWTISSAPLEKIGNLVISITPAFFSAVQDDVAQLRRYLSRLTEALAYVIVPASVGIALLADDLVPVVLGQKWIGVVGPLRLLGLLVAFRALATLPGKILTAMGDARFVMWTTLASALVLPVGFILGSRWGTTGIAAAWIFLYPPLMLPIYAKTLKRIGMTASQYFASVMPSLRASLIMGCVLLLARWAMSNNLPTSLRLLASVAVSATAYAAALFIFDRERLAAVFLTIRSFHENNPESRSAAPTFRVPPQTVAAGMCIDSVPAPPLTESNPRHTQPHTYDTAVCAPTGCDKNQSPLAGAAPGDVV